jgi:N-acetylglucosaminyldiphosphoundecaprenol N-acetyl-beta-D-mannosaminyltransferase
MDSLNTNRAGIILDTAVDITSHEISCARTFELVDLGKPAYVCFATAHMLVEATRNPAIRAAYRDASIVNPDGTPLAWCLKLMGHADAHCVNGPTNTPILLREAERRGIKVGFYGGQQETLNRLREVLAASYPSLRISYMHSPPYRELSESELAADLAEINRSGTQMLFVGLGSPKQEIWMSRNHLSLNCVCLGVGAVFQFLTGEVHLPPVWVQRMGVTWLVRLCQEPRRLARRNLYSPVFVFMAIAQFCSYAFRRATGLPPRSRPSEWEAQ